MRNVYVLGVGMIKFGRYPEKDVSELAGEAALLALKDAGLHTDSGSLSFGLRSEQRSAEQFADQGSGRRTLWTNRGEGEVGTDPASPSSAARTTPSPLPSPTRRSRSCAAPPSGWLSTGPGSRFAASSGGPRPHARSGGPTGVEEPASKNAGSRLLGPGIRQIPAR